MVIFDENEVRPMGRTASGVKGINLDNEATCIGMDIGHDDDNILIVTKNGYGKKTLLKEYRITKRGSKGVTAVNVTEKNGPMISFHNVIDGLDLLIITESGMIIRLPIEQVSQLGRVTQGVKLINLKDDQYVSTISLTMREEEIEENDDNNSENEPISEEIQQVTEEN
jgi:DNA gyrase subunit A